MRGKRERACGGGVSGGGARPTGAWTVCATLLIEKACSQAWERWGDPIPCVGACPPGSRRVARINALSRADVGQEPARLASLDAADNLPAPEVLAAEVVEDLQAARERFAATAETLQQARGGDSEPKVTSATD